MNSLKNVAREWRQILDLTSLNNPRHGAVALAARAHARRLCFSLRWRRRTNLLRPGLNSRFRNRKAKSGFGNRQAKLTSSTRAFTHVHFPGHRPNL